MVMAPGKKGTADEDVQDYFDSGSQQEPDFAVDGPTATLNVLSPDSAAHLQAAPRTRPLAARPPRSAAPSMP
jgi:hypothetical protein